MYTCMWGYLDKYIRVATWPPQTKIPGSAPDRLVRGNWPLHNTFQVLRS